MNKAVKFFTSPSKNTGRFLFFSLILIICIHVILFAYYTESNKKAESKVNRDLIIQQIVNLIERVNYTDPKQRQEMVTTVDIPDLDINFDTTPEWPLHFNSEASLWKMSQAMRKQSQMIQLSLKYGAKTWLNLSMPIGNTSWWMQIVLLGLELIVVGSIALAIWSINRFSAPLKNFKKAAERLGIDLDAPPLRIYGPNVVRDTAYAMNQMQERIRELIRERTQMLAALSHDLRTPITRMKLRAQFIADKELQEKNIDDLDQMEAMISDTLTFAKNTYTKEKYVKLDLVALLQSVYNDFIDMGYPLTIQMPEHRIVVWGQSASLRRAFNNIIENAINYGKEAALLLTTQQDQVFIQMIDQGPGIPEDQIKNVFEPFYRGEQSRSRTTGGIGLGLAVTRDIIKHHKGSIELKNAAEGGLEVLIVLPLVVVRS